MKFSCLSIFLIASTAFVYGLEKGVDQIFERQEYAVEKIAQVWPWKDKVNDRPFRTRDCFRPVDGSPEPISCKAFLLAWRWDMKSKSCKPSAFGGCNKTKNLFFTKAECEAVAKPVCKKFSDILENINLIDVLDVLIYKLQE
ncbi:uncharacterized protein LOC126885678 isoform X2 [Diabrotica virgifera virgifera]|uniref:BPTI/Kunitz inhibitor domain-containing protein n=1 Tax=Diabrotica virgifera virgifera TaxID=50390 RepID=A0ABM5KDQ7_DIAVI|nr:uncharacterized protein LOC126885678 isoform X2 [Diabrotica virgifera virgifera]